MNQIEKTKKYNAEWHKAHYDSELESKRKKEYYYKNREAILLKAKTRYHTKKLENIAVIPQP